jgi:competence protein ComEA
MTLKGIGAKRAAQIVAYRQAHGLFKTVSDLSHVRGIGEKGLVRLQANNPSRITINTGANLK